MPFRYKRKSMANKCISTCLTSGKKLIPLMKIYALFIQTTSVLKNLIIIARKIYIIY